MTLGPSAHIFTVVDVGISDHFCMLLTVRCSIEQDILELTVWKHFLAAEVAANFKELLIATPSDFLQR